MSDELSSISEVEKASEKYLGHDHLQVLNRVVPSVDTDDFVELIARGNQQLDYLLFKYNTQKLEKCNPFEKKISILIQTNEIEQDILLLKKIQSELQVRRNIAKTKLAEFTPALEGLRAAYKDEKYIDSVFPNKDEYARLYPKIMGVVQIADLKKQTFNHVIQQSENLELEITVFTDTTMFQIKEYLSRYGAKKLLTTEVKDTLYKKIDIQQKILNVASLTSTMGIAVLLCAAFMTLIGFPVPENALSGRASFTFSMFVFGISFIVSSAWMLLKELYGERKKGGAYTKTLVHALVGSIAFSVTSGIFIKLDSESYSFYQVLPLYGILVFVLALLSTVGSFIYKRKAHQIKDTLIDAKYRLKI